MNLLKSFLPVLLILALPVRADYVDDALAPVLSAADARDFDGALDQLDRLTQTSEDPRLSFHLARLQLRAGQVEEAEATVEDLVRAHPDFVDAHYLNGLVQLAMVGEVSIFSKLGKAKDALEAWQRTTELDPSHKDAHYAIFAWYASAPGIAGGDLKKAEALLPAIYEMDPGYGAMASALLLTRQEKFEQVKDEYLKAIELMDRAGPHFAYAQFCLQQEDWQCALNEIRQFELKEKRWWDPDITLVHLARAAAYAGLGDAPMARQSAEAGLSLKPNKRIKAMLEEIASGK